MAKRGRGRPSLFGKRKSIPLYLDDTDHEDLSIFLQYWRDSTGELGFGIATIARDLLLSWLSRERNKSLDGFRKWCREHKAEIVESYGKEAYKRNE